MDNLTPYQRWQMEKYKNILPDQPSIYPVDLEEENQEIPNLNQMVNEL